MGIVTWRLKAGDAIVRQRRKWMSTKQQNEVMQAVSNQRICKHASTTKGLLLRSVFSVRSAQSSYKGDNWDNPVSWVLSAVELCKGGWEETTIQYSSENGWQEVLNGNRRRKDLIAGSCRISTVRSRCQGTAGEYITRWERLSRCCGELWIVQISDGAVITCSSESRGISAINPIIQSKTPSIVTHIKRDSILESVAVRHGVAVEDVTKRGGVEVLEQDVENSTRWWMC
jgi:hypothetical protein